MDDVRLRIPSNRDLQWRVVLAFVRIPVGLLYRLGRCHSACRTRWIRSREDLELGVCWHLPRRGHTKCGTRCVPRVTSVVSVYLFTVINIEMKLTKD